MKNTTKILTAATGAATALLFTAGAASATVTFDPGSGTGFVGKGDVQTAYGWNNQTLQANAGGLTFAYDATDSYAAVCTWTTGTGTRGERTHNISLNRETSVNSAIAYNARVHNQIDGFNLTGLGTTTTTGTLPAVGAACVGNSDGIDFNGAWTAVTLTGSTGALYANYGASSMAIWQLF
jgi:hypothetical protein